MATNFKIENFKNASESGDIGILNDIHLNHINISIFKRTVEHLEEEIMQFIKQDVQLKLNGTYGEIVDGFKGYLVEQELPKNNLLNDFSYLLKSFEAISQAKRFRIFFSTIRTDMCRRFHTDANNLRLLCTYHGAGTLWLPETAENRYAHQSGEDNEQIVTNSNLIQQASTGDVLILKGGLYPKGKAVIHRSPSIEKNKKTRLLLRIDMNEPLNFL